MPIDLVPVVRDAIYRVYYKGKKGCRRCYGVTRKTQNGWSVEPRINGAHYATEFHGRATVAARAVVAATAHEGHRIHEKRHARERAQLGKESHAVS